MELEVLRVTIEVLREELLLVSNVVESSYMTRRSDLGAEGDVELENELEMVWISIDEAGDVIGVLNEFVGTVRVETTSDDTASLPGSLPLIA